MKKLVAGGYKVKTDVKSGVFPDPFDAMTCGLSNLGNQCNYVKCLKERNWPDWMFNCNDRKNCGLAPC